MKKVCKRCIMDSENDKDLILYADGTCNHCLNYENAIKNIKTKEQALADHQQTIAKIKQEGINQKYDCLIGVSGGVDSSYLAYIAKEAGLKALLVHCDNGWNSELAVHNIQKICDNTGFDLDTNVLDWEEFKDIQLAFMKANVVDVELPYDYALVISMYKAALKHQIKYVLTGHNVVTEGTYLPKGWRHDKMDIVNIKDIHKKFGKLKMKSFPHFSFLKQRWVDKKLSYIQPLNNHGYNEEEAKEVIQEKLGWQAYSAKHYENVFTRFYQGYILPEKFKIDKRQFHYSVKVQSGQLTRDEALALMLKPKYNDAQLAEDKIFVIKKLGLTEKQFADYINASAVSHSNFKSIKSYWEFYFSIIKLGKKILMRK